MTTPHQDDAAQAEILNMKEESRLTLFLLVVFFAAGMITGVLLVYWGMK